MEQTEGESVTLWQYEERELTPAEYAQLKISEESTQAILGFNKQAVIDEYTEELMEGGLI